ncbi:hypothetical protein EVAR_16362_1 [Eumeta japonica]|uniref:Uncharacterized protein n=1 Tax=Eumeta variegata TaxID=151549 RepID=A0A4C1VSZ4_EUMVA|nr:hypothetical protein EVAR_16362_1 [Eumeta japonica]
MWDQTFHAARVRMTVGGRVAVQLAAVPGPPPFLCGLYSDTREHHVQIIEYILGFLGPGKDGENHNGEPSLRQSVHRVQEATAEVGLDFVYREVGRNAADNGL